MRRTSLYLLGSGIRGTLQFTAETMQALRACRRVFVLHADSDVVDFARRHCAEVEDLAPLYETRSVRDDVYRKISELLVQEAVRSGPIGFLVHGNPLFLVSATEYTLDLAERHGLRVSVLPAVSSFDTLLCDLRLDYGYAVQVFDSTTLLKAGWTPNPQVPLLLFQLASTLDRAVIVGEPSPQVLAPLVELLTPLYGPGHGVEVVFSSSHPLEPSTITRLALGELTTVDLELWRRPTLHVPPVR